MDNWGHHGLSIDLETWFQGEYVRPRLKEMPKERGLRASLEPLLSLLRRYQTRATFFVVGDLIQDNIELLRELLAEGHELGCHGWSHRTLWDLGKEGLRDELILFREAVERFELGQVVGFRAPSWSLNQRTSWALAMLAEFGYLYDSSIFPTLTPLYGVPRAPLGVYRPHPTNLTRHSPDGPLWELPATVFSLGPLRVPVAGGAYLRLLPFPLLSWCLGRVQQQGRPLVLYFHPWEMCEGTPRIDLPLIPRLITYGGQKQALGRFNRLLQRYKFAPLGQILGVWSPSEAKSEDAPRLKNP